MNPSCTRGTAHCNDFGFTLIEVLVAIALVAIMTLLSWRAMDGMLRTQDALEERADAWQTLQSSLAQWRTDLNQMADLPDIPAWDWDGKVLRLTRTLPDEVESTRVVAWTWRADPTQPSGGNWQRWQSPPLRLLRDWQDAWALARQWSQTPTEATRSGEAMLVPVSGWQLFVHRGGSWTNPLSSDAAISSAQSGTTSAVQLPDAVRMVLDVFPVSGLQGPLTIDWVNPTL